ncbi:MULTISPECIES: nucleoside monophosphate kinase [unclassified Mycoplasma]|uniref:nucleoside monophosphate kinase n=1 Tax=unclassified Mycoplasma TaxID=2683645 RepID=UPI0013753434
MIGNFIFLGPPGVGKGTLSKQLAAHYNLKHISSGEIFREAVKSGSKLGQAIKNTLDKGAYVDDNLTNQVIYQAIKSSHSRGQGVILDGYPRTLNQAHFLENEGIKVDHVIWLDAPIDVIIERLIKRGRADDHPETIRQRIAVYRQQTQPLVDYYEAHKTVLKLDTSGSEDENFASLIARLERD